MHTQRPALPDRVPTRTIVSAITMFIGVMFLAWGYFSNRIFMIYAGLVLILGGVANEMLFGLIRPFSKPVVPRHHR
jgi:drug/metabolite transporter (DMT)-like permease